MLDTTSVFSTLDDMEQLFVETEAAARGVSIHEVVLDLVRDGIAEASSATDRQWKSH
jgi:hypothetical protein